MGDVAAFQLELAAALKKTIDDSAKFDRFSTAVLGAGVSQDKKNELLEQLKKSSAIRETYNQRNLPAEGTPKYGPARVDAFGAIYNQVTAEIAGPADNAAPAIAPVSYPFLWDTPQHDWVQWNGAVENSILPVKVPPIVNTRHVGALGRNAGEVIGVFGQVDASNGGFLGLGGYPSSINKQNLIDIEEWVRKLWSPQWPTQFPPVDLVAATAGKALFKQNCRCCHDDTFNRTDPDRRVIAQIMPVGTDQSMAKEFTRTAKTGVLKGRIAELPGLRTFRDQEPVKDLLVHVVQRAIFGTNIPTDTTQIVGTAPRLLVNAELNLGGGKKLLGAFSDVSFLNDPSKISEVVSPDRLVAKSGDIQLLQDISGFGQAGRFFTAQGTLSTFNLNERAGTKVDSSLVGTRIRFEEPVWANYSYKARPLNGIWATAPYLHNGSVPNLNELLKSSANRVKSFRVGSREFDPQYVGFSTDEGDFVFDTTLPGNSNQGHEYPREFTDEERRQLIEYMKTL